MCRRIVRPDLGHGRLVRPPILIVKTGTTDPPVVARHGDYEDWFIARLVNGPARCTTVSVHDRADLPDPTPYGGVLVTGSPLSVRDELPWVQPLGPWILGCADTGVPVLAVCFGHQVLGETLGGHVARNPAGREVGTITVDLTPEGESDPLFAGLDASFQVQSTHRDALVRPPRDPRVVRLAGNDNTHWQAFGVGPRLRSVQFHPELDGNTLQDLLKNRGQTGEVHRCPAGRHILENWDTHWVSSRSVR